MKKRNFKYYLEKITEALETGSRDKLQCCYYGEDGLDSARASGRITEKEYSNLERIIEGACSLII